MDARDTRAAVRPPSEQSTGSPLSDDVWTLQALAFLERSREVAAEDVIDVTRGETPTSAREAAPHPGSLPAV